ncbi:S-(+)-linalool synthase- chloroplastic [Striga hermonthica]|uniref:S-(+)-linalool synthase- chloroplastic n=1 Tax=Striga hermonthica TaxID=68872 RepID=A0A9N7P1U1_STRHE|nr:S-(+)-linalool synthase- chloroplastic [Striga hermonthica]
MEHSFLSSQASRAIFEDTFLLGMKNSRIEQVRSVLAKFEQNSLESLVLVDIIQRLGLDYLFEDEIGAILDMHNILATKSAFLKHELYQASLCFRLLRQQGYQVNADDFFGKFKDEEGGFCFGDGLNTDTKAALALHEASHVRVNGEEILHEAAKCSSQYLSLMLINNIKSLDQDHAKTAKHSLLYPQHKTMTQFMSMDFLRSLKGQYGWESSLQELAELEYTSLESLHKDELVRAVKWWENLGLSSQLKSLRNEPIKWHLWSIVTLWDPKWSEQRILLTKPISLVFAVDDIFDLYGTLEELTLFTDAVNKWKICAAEKLPPYMKTCFMAIYDSTNEISRVVSQEHGWNPVEFLKKEWKNLFDAFLKEAEWFSSGKLPKSKEYLKNGVISSGVVMVLAHLFFLMGNRLTKETESLLNDQSQGITYSVATLLRLLDDLRTAQDEQQEGYDGSYIECYMEEHGHSLESAREHVMAMVSCTWENLNKKSLCSVSPFSLSFRKACLNAARMVPMVYAHDKNLRIPVVEHLIKSLLRESSNLPKA